MNWKNVEIHNIAEIIDNGDGSISWKRVPSNVHDAMEIEIKEKTVFNSTGVELRFVLNGDCAKIKMCAYTDDPNTSYAFHVYRGDIQGGWQDHEVHKHVNRDVQEYVIEKSGNISQLKEMTERCGYDWDCEVIRIIFDGGRYKIYDIEGDIEPPKQEQCPAKTLLTYGSSITHGSNALDSSHAWPAVLAHNLNMDVRNLGFAGSCALEPEMAEYIAAEGDAGKWDMAILELGINVIWWDTEKIHSRVENIIQQVAGRNPDKPVFVISPFYHCGEDFTQGEQERTDGWRNIIEETVEKLNYSNVVYINGLELLGHMSFISADMVHPNIYGVQQIAERLTKRISEYLGGKTDA